MARSKADPSDDRPQDRDQEKEKFDRSENNRLAGDAVSRAADEIEEIWNSPAARARRRYRAESVTPEPETVSSSADAPEASDSPRSTRAYRGRLRRAIDAEEPKGTGRTDHKREENPSENEPIDDMPQDGYLGSRSETTRKSDPFTDRVQSENNMRSEREAGDENRTEDNDGRDGHENDGDYYGDPQGGYHKGYQQGYQQERYRQGYQQGYRQGGYRQGYQQGGYRQGYQQGGYQNPRYRQERYYRRRFRDTDLRVLRDSDIRSNDEIPGNAGRTGVNESAPATERFQQDRSYRPFFPRRFTNPGYPNDILDHMEPENAPRGKYGEPLSLAEELASERYRTKDSDEATAEIFTPDEVAALDTREISGADYIALLQGMEAQQLVKEARNHDPNDAIGKRKREAVFRVLKEKIKASGLMYGEGTLEILPEEFGFLRNPEFHYLSCPDDIYISPSQIRRFGLRNGSTVFGQIRPPKEKERYFALLRIESINDEDPNLLLSKPMYDELTAMHPDQRIILETPEEDMNTRVVDLIVPVGFGQRGLIVSPPRAGKTILMQKMARSVLTNYPDAYVFILLVDERPEEVTDMERQVKGPHCEVISSTFDEPSSRHIQVSEMVLDKAKRMVEYGKDVVIFLDSITRLARAWNSEYPTSGKTLSGGVDAGALQRPKKFFGSARKVEEGGSLTIIATALVDTGSRMDEVIFEEFKGTGNLEIWLDRSLVDKRIWPAIDISRSGTRREEMILDPEEYKRMTILRRILNEMNPPDAMEFLTQKLTKTQNNAEFLMSLNIPQY
jgi:transcription termination factor Rho